MVCSACAFRLRISVVWRYVLVRVSMVAMRVLVGGKFHGNQVQVSVPHTPPRDELIRKSLDLLERSAEDAGFQTVIMV